MMKRVFLGEVLQTIYLDISVYENSIMYIHQTGSEEMHQKTYIAKQHTLEDILHDLDKQIHPRYTKVIVDINPHSFKIVQKIIDDKYNKYIAKVEKIIIENDKLKTITIIEEQMLEMVQVVKYHPKRIDVKEFMANTVVYLMKDIQ